MSRVTGSLRTFLALLVLLTLGLGVHLRQRWTAAGGKNRCEARGESFTAYDADGSILLVPAERRDGIVLPAGARLELSAAETADLRVERLEFRLLRSLEDSVVELRMRGDETGAYELKLAPPNSYGVALFHRSTDARPERLAARTDAPFVPAMARPFSVGITLEGPRIAVAVSEEPVLAIEDSRRAAGRFELIARGGGVRVSSFRVVGRDGGEPFTIEEDFAALAPRAPAAFVARELGRTLAVLTGLALCAACLLGTRAFAARPDAAARAVTAALLLSPSALHAIGCALAGATPTLAGHSVAALLGPALVLARDRVKNAGAGSEATPRFVFVLALVAAGFGAFAAWDREGRLLAPWLAEARIAETLAPPPSYRSAKATTLDSGNCLRIPGSSFRDLALAATIRLKPRALLEVRLHGKGAEGVALFVSADSRVRTRFVRETQDEFETIGSSTGPVATDRELRLAVFVSGSSYHATIDGAEVARATERLFPAGETILLAARGEVAVATVAVEPVAPEADRASARSLARRDRFLAAGRFLGILIAYALLSVLLSSRPIRHGFAVASFALAPFALALLEVDRFGAERDLALAATLFAGGFPLLAAIASAPGSTPLRFHGSCLLAIGLGAFAFVTARERAWPTDPPRLNALTPLDWSGERIEPDLLDLEHPLLRRWNPHLVDHRFNGATIERDKPPGVLRVVALGTSSTQGYGAAEDWPSLLASELRRDGRYTRRLELINAAWKGSNGQRLRSFLDDVLVSFEPDVVLLSLYYNDSVNLTQFDEDRYYAGIGAPGARRGPFDDFTERFRLGSGRELFRELERRFELGERDSTASYLELGGVAPPPPERFRATLRRFAETARAASFRLVLIQEPIAGDRPRVWKDEFRAVMNEVGAEYGLVVADPAAALARSGGKKLFMDEVHPYATGHAVTAAYLAPIVRQVLDERSR